MSVFMTNKIFLLAKETPSFWLTWSLHSLLSLSSSLFFEPQGEGGAKDFLYGGEGYRKPDKSENSFLKRLRLLIFK